MSKITPLSEAPSISIEGLTAAYGRIEVIHGVDLSVNAGSVFALLGPNGAGKSTLLKVLSSRVRATGGTVRIGEIELKKQSTESLTKAGICAIPEGRGVFPNLTVHDNLMMWSYQGVSQSQVETIAFEQFPKLKDRRKQLAGTLSGGEQQMLAISRALVGDPKVLLLDEISMGLAPLIVAELYELVAQIAERGVTILLVEQFVTTAVSVATDAAIMLHGKIHAQGTPEEMGEQALRAYLSGESAS
jgi:branched-chain amino acid transport system ATP-binding protein